MSHARDISALLRTAAQALGAGDAVTARAVYERIAQEGDADAASWLGLAMACRALDDKDAYLSALDTALSLDPRNLRALIMKADHLAAEGDRRGASAFYGAALQYLPHIDKLPSHLRDALRRAQAANQRTARELEDFVRAKLDAQGLGPGQAPGRLTTAVDVLFGRKRTYVQQPRYFFYPELPQVQFYERPAFPWLDAVESATADIRAELECVIGEDFKPYVTHAPGRPSRDQMGMLDNPSWSALFLYKDGAVQPHAPRCPRTLAALETAPLTRIPRRTPSILFSKLAAGAHIPPHTGMLNARLICHLPLIVPPGCEFRVGNDVRTWVEGQAWVFDDTIEHEAWNRSREDRYVLLFDVWRPELSEEERAGITALCAAIDSYSGGASWDA